GRVEDLARLAHHLPFLRRVAPLAHRARARDDVAGDRTVPHLPGLERRAPGDDVLVGPAGALRPLLVELTDARLSGAGDRLVARHDHASDAGRAVERCQ